MNEQISPAEAKIQSAADLSRVKRADASVDFHEDLWQQAEAHARGIKAAAGESKRLARTAKRAIHAAGERERDLIDSEKEQATRSLEAQFNYENNRDAYQQAAIEDAARAGVETSFGEKAA